MVEINLMWEVQNLKLGFFINYLKEARSEQSIKIQDRRGGGMRIVHATDLKNTNAGKDC